MKKSPRTCIIPFRVTPEEKEKIIEKAFTSYREPSMYLRDCALNKQIIVVPGAEQIAGELRRIGNNLNQLTMKFNAAFKESSDRRIQKLIQLTPQLEYQSQMIGQILIHIASLCSQR